MKSPLPRPLLVEIASTITNPPIRSHWSMIHNQSTTNTNPRSTSTVPVDTQPLFHKNALSVFVGVSVCGCVWFSVDFVVWLCVGLFDFWLILWCVCVVVVVVGSVGLQWWCLAVLSCGDVGGSDGSVWLAVGVINCRDYRLERERERESGEERMWGREKILNNV